MSLFDPTPFRWPQRWGLSITTAFLLLAAAVVGGALYFVDQAGRRTIAIAQAETVDAEVNLLVNIFNDEGLPGLLNALQHRLSVYRYDRRADYIPIYNILKYKLSGQNSASGHIYALADENNRLIAGNLKRWPDGLIPGTSWQYVPTQGKGGSIYVSSVRLSDGSLLIVGNTDGALGRFRLQIVEAGITAILVIVAACGLAALIITLHFRSKVQTLAAVAAKVTHGDFSARAPGANEHSPFGQIAAAQNVMLDRIEHLVVGLTTVTDSLAHDLRTPLSRQRRYLESGLVSTDPRAREQALEAALQESDHIVATFSALIDIARANGGLSRDAMETLDLRDLLREVQTLFEPLIEERAGHLDLDAPEPVRVSGHKALLMQAVSNLVDNAIKHSPDHHNVRISLRQTASHAEVIVSDHGVGIPVADRDELMKRFTRAGNAPPGGMGLGLAIAKACAVLHRGSVWLEDNNPGLRARLVLSKS